MGLSFSSLILSISTILFSNLFIFYQHCKQYSDNMDFFSVTIFIFPRWSLYQELTLPSMRRGESGAWKRGKSYVQRRREKGKNTNLHTWAFYCLQKLFLSYPNFTAPRITICPLGKVGSHLRFLLSPLSLLFFQYHFLLLINPDPSERSLVWA